MTPIVKTKALGLTMVRMAVSTETAILYRCAQHGQQLGGESPLRAW